MTASLPKIAVRWEKAHSRPAKGTRTSRQRRHDPCWICCEGGHNFSLLLRGLCEYGNLAEHGIVIILASLTGIAEAISDIGHNVDDHGWHTSSV
jgi:hypothetical protein